ncbi:MAG: hypothetical protein ACFFER_13145 [Candidatus Thorarchaeota archaeon]
MTEMRGNIPWEILDLNHMRKQELLEAGYLGGVRIGRKTIYLLRHYKVKMVKKEEKDKEPMERKIIALSSPRFMIFDQDADPLLRDTGNPMSMEDLDAILDFHFLSKKREEIKKHIFNQVLESFEETALVHKPPPKIKPEEKKKPPSKKKKRKK